jgi:uncharacterized membrane protein YqgA involved in biofilm formation
MRSQQPFRHVPRRALNAAVIVGGVLGILLQAEFNWSILATFVITLGLCAVSVGIVAAVYTLIRK